VYIGAPKKHAEPIEVGMIALLAPPQKYNGKMKWKRASDQGFRSLPSCHSQCTLPGSNPFNVVPQEGEWNKSKKYHRQQSHGESMGTSSQ
jgi:hypothetical protein